jgi:hypothetical protein
MSTRCTITVKDSHGEYTLYRHCDGYPDGDGGVIATLRAAFPLAWKLPRFEAADFSAALVAAWKSAPGNILLCRDRHEIYAHWHYEITGTGARESQQLTVVATHLPTGETETHVIESAAL